MKPRLGQWFERAQGLLNRLSWSLVQALLPPVPPPRPTLPASLHSQPAAQSLKLLPDRPTGSGRPSAEGTSEELGRSPHLGVQDGEEGDMEVGWEGQSASWSLPTCD